MPGNKAHVDMDVSGGDAEVETVDDPIVDPATLALSNYMATLMRDEQEADLPPIASPMEAANDVNVDEGNTDQVQEEHSEIPSAAPEEGEKDPTPRVSFAVKPSYFPQEDFPQEENPKNDRQKRSSSNSDRKTRKSSQEHHSDRDIVLRVDDKHGRPAEPRRSSRKSSTDEDERRAEPKRSSRRSSTDVKHTSSPQRSSPSRSNSRRGSSSRTKQSKQKDQRSRKSSGDDQEERNSAALQDVNLDDSSSSSEDPSDDKYEAEAQGRGRRKRRSSKKRRRKSGRKSSSLPTDHSENEQSPSRHQNKKRPYTRSLGVNAIETSTKTRVQSHSLSSEVARMQKEIQDLEKPKRISDIKRKQRRERRKMRNWRVMICGIVVCLLSTVGTAGVLWLVRMRASAPEPLTPTVLSAPTTEQCRAISQGVGTTSDRFAEMKQFHIITDVELDAQQTGFDAPFIPLLEATLQALVMPVLAGCEPVTLRRFRRMMGPPLENRRMNHERLPHYIVSNGLVVDAQFDLFPLAATSSHQSRYSIKVLIDIWVQEEVDNHLLANKVWRAFDGFMTTPGIPEDFPLSSLTVVSVDPIVGAQEPREGTAFPTHQPSARPSQAPSLASSASPTTRPSARPSTSPSSRPSSSPSTSPSSLPTLRHTGGPSSEPSIVPTMIPSLQPSKFPTPRPTLLPTRFPTAAPVTSNPTRAPVPINGSIDVVIVGAGAAGLSAAYHLQREGVSVVVLEASSAIGGRVKKDSTWDLGLDLGAEWLDYATSDFKDGNDMLSAILDRTVNKNIIQEPNLAHFWSGSTMRYTPPGSSSTDHRWVDSTWWDFLNEEMMTNLPPDTVLLNSVVKTIDYGYERPIVYCEDGRTYEGSYVIVTASMKILQDGMISFSPSLPSRYKEAIDDIEMGSGVKVFVEFTEKFFPDIFRLDPDTETYNFKDCESSSHGVRYFYNPVYGQTSTKHILGMFAYADIADLYVGQSHDAIIRNVLGLLDQIFNGQASAKFIKGVVQDWSSEPYVRAAYTNFAPKDAVDQLRSPIDDKVFFAGESVFSKDSDWGFVQGAALCGEDVAEAIIDAINGR